MVETLYGNLEFNFKHMIDDVMNKIIDSHLQDEEIAQEQLEQAYKELEPSLFITDDLVEHMAIVFGEALECEDSITIEIVIQMLKGLTLKQLVKANIVTVQDVVEQYYNNL
tara:strand:+ start:8025 stop:8357 length:333 start_codon:yes stop_codon:yes gene_type:complete